MSNFLYGKILCNCVDKIIPSKIDFLITKYCINNNFAIHFWGDSSKTKDIGENIYFSISDNFTIKYCEDFLKPIIYTLNGEPLLDNFLIDIAKLEGLLNLILSFEFVEKVELRFSYVEVDENEYEVCKIHLKDLKKSMLQKYLMATHFPVVKFIIEQ